MIWCKVFVYGASGHGKVVADAWLSRPGTSVDGFIGDRPELRGELRWGAADAPGCSPTPPASRWPADTLR